MNSKEVSGVILPAKVAFDCNWESKALVTGSGSRSGLLRRAKRHDQTSATRYARPWNVMQASLDRH